MSRISGRFIKPPRKCNLTKPRFRQKPRTDCTFRQTGFRKSTSDEKPNTFWLHLLVQSIKTFYEPFAYVRGILQKPSDLYRYWPFQHISSEEVRLHHYSSQEYIFILPEIKKGIISSSYKLALITGLYLGVLPQIENPIGFTSVMVMGGFMVAFHGGGLAQHLVNLRNFLISRPR